MQWLCLILPVKNGVAEFIAMWRHLFYKFVKHTFNRCVQNNTMCKCTNYANWFRRFAVVGIQT